MKKIGPSTPNFQRFVRTVNQDKMCKTTWWGGKYFISYKEGASGQSEWGIIRLNFFERAARAFRNKFKSTYQTTIKEGLRNEDVQPSMGKNGKIDIQATVSNIKLRMHQSEDTSEDMASRAQPLPETEAPEDLASQVQPSSETEISEESLTEIEEDSSDELEDILEDFVTVSSEELLVETPPLSEGLQGSSNTTYFFDVPEKPDLCVQDYIRLILYSGLAHPGQVMRVAPAVNWDFAHEPFCRQPLLLVPMITPLGVYSSTPLCTDPRGNKICISFEGDAEGLALARSFEDAFSTFLPPKKVDEDGSTTFLIRAEKRNEFLQQLHFNPPPLPQYVPPQPQEFTESNNLAKALVHYISPGEEGNPPKVDFSDENIYITFEGYSFLQAGEFCDHFPWINPIEINRQFIVFAIESSQREMFIETLSNHAYSPPSESSKTRHVRHVFSFDSTSYPYTPPSDPRDFSDVERVLQEITFSKQTTCEFIDDGTRLKITFPSEGEAKIFGDVFPRLLKGYKGLDCFVATKDMELLLDFLHFEVIPKKIEKPPK